MGIKSVADTFSHTADEKTSSELRRVRAVENPRKRILFLGYSEDKTSLIDDLANQNCEVWHTDQRIRSTAGFDLVVSFGFRSIISKEIIHSSPAPIINLHISYLPWNRGAHPNFWSFFDRTPSGVSIHLMDEGVDTGPVLYQKYVNFRPEEKTFVQTHDRLIHEIEELFRENLQKIIGGDYVPIPQSGEGTYHRKKDLPREFSGWDSEIEAEIRRLDGILSSTMRGTRS